MRVDSGAAGKGDPLDRVGELVAAGASLSAVPDASDLAAYESWDQYETIHRRNASIVFLRIERESLFK